MKRPNYRAFVTSISFIGVVFHEFGHKLFCHLTGVKVIKVCYFRFGNPSGYVLHEKPKRFTQSFFISIGPFISGLFFAMLFYLISLSYTHEMWLKYVFIWLGASIAINSFPSTTDMKSLWRDTNKHIWTNILAVIGYPFAFIFWIANALNVFWFDLIYAFLLYYLVTLLSA